MEVRNLSQGWQTALETNTNTVNNAQCVQPVQNNSTSAPVDSKNGSDTVGGKLSNNEKAATEQDVKKAVDKLNELLEGKSTHVEYEQVGKSKHMAIRIVDSQTKEVIKEIPPKKIIEMIDKLCEMAGIMIDGKA
ncbi:flagellar protein FlaG [Clostridium sp. DJ247]|uniref:flagellar protein FlaG n=1 Tax=Clostridium sp. DJ247 TaxID=2726188 RepID=UPI0016240C15|nr:flagellar protein FlaG [Clostridium sp. DJ247]MBC2582582.1 flagellar protein FlaG [Clostridium sp. DJ247]